MKKTGTDRAKSDKPKRHLMDSLPLRDAARKKRLTVGVNLQGVGAPRLTIFPYESLEKSRLIIDETYQRSRLAPWVNTLANLIAEGAEVPDPITVAQRQDGTLAIIDGQQRFWAHLEAKKPIKALVYTVDSHETERAFFLVMNNTRGVSPTYQINAWVGPSIEILRHANEDPRHTLFGRIGFAGDRAVPFQSNILCRGILRLFGITSSMPVQPMMERIDLELKHPEMKQKLESYLSLLGTIFNSRERVPLLVILGLGRVCYELWPSANDIHFPTPRAMNNMRATNWSNLVHGSFSTKNLPLVVDRMKSQWVKTEDDSKKEKKTTVA